VEPKKTPLYDEHIRLNGKMADFAGWMMPLWYESGQSEEHHATRSRCGLFDICHMGEYSIEGSGSLEFLSWVLTNKIGKIVDGQAMYNFMLNDNGGVVDDCIVYRFDLEHWMLVVNAGNIDGDFKWLQDHAPSNVKLENISEKTAKIDLQGPNSPRLLSKFIDRDKLLGMKFFRFLLGEKIDGMEVLISRTGYTGEIGFELYTDVKNGVDLWNLLLTEGKEFGILPCGLGARDTLRTEAGLPLYGHELRADRVALGHPWEFAIDFDGDFLGKEKLVEERQNGLKYFVLPFLMNGRRKAMPGWEVLIDGEVIGEVLSGVISPSLDNRPIGFVGVNRPLERQTRLIFKQRGREGELEGSVAEVPFVPLTSRKKMSQFL